MKLNVKNCWRGAESEIAKEMNMYEPLERTIFENGYTLSVVAAPFGDLEAAVITPQGRVLEPVTVSSWMEVNEIRKKAKEIRGER